MRIKKFSAIMAVVMTLMMVLSSTAFAAVPGTKISNELSASFNVAEPTSITVTDNSELAAALSNDHYTTINLQGSFSGFKVNRSVTIKGGTVAPAAIEGQSVGIYAAASGIMIDGVTIDGENSELDNTRGVLTDTGIALTVKNSNISNVASGIYLNSGSKLTAAGNTISHVAAGIGSENADLTGEISGNTISDFSSEAIGMYLPVDSNGTHMTVKEAEALAASLETGNSLQPGAVKLYGFDNLITLSWKTSEGIIGSGAGTAIDVESPFEIEVTATSTVDVEKVLYILEFTDSDGNSTKGADTITATLGDGAPQSVGYDDTDKFWYWGDRDSGFTFERGTVSTTFQVTIGPGEYNVKVYAVQLD